MSPVEGYTFSNCRSMQNIQLLTQTGGVNKYVCKYIGKVDEQNYVVVKANNNASSTSTSGSASLRTRSTFLHNTKITSSKIQEDKDRKKDDKYPQFTYVSHNEQTQQILGYAEVRTNMNFRNIATMPLEYRKGVELDNFVISKKANNDSEQTGSVSNDIRCSIKGLFLFLSF